MPSIQTKLSHLAFSTSGNKETYKNATLKMIDAILNTKRARQTIHDAVGRNVDKAVVMYETLSLLFGHIIDKRLLTSPRFSLSKK